MDVKHGGPIRLIAREASLHNRIARYKENECLAYVAIDFGTTFSGFAFSIKDEDDKILMNKNWGAELSCASYKAPTCILTGPGGKFHSFGYEAEKNYSDILAEDPEADYNLYRHFKMMLNGTGLNNKSKIKSTVGTSALAVDIFAMALTFLKGKFFSEITKSSVSTMSPSDVKWVLTVPAIWSDKAKYFMREASYKAGLIDDINSSQLDIALEPETASIYCRTIKLDDFKTKFNELRFQEGQKYMVIDAGGGTIDITFHKILSSGDVDEIFPPSGGPWGGLSVNKAFEKLLRDIFSEEFIHHYQKTQPHMWLEFMLNFEKIKYGLTDDQSQCRITISYNFIMDYASFMKVRGNIERVINQCGVKGISFRNGMLILDRECVNNLFHPTIESICTHLKELNNKLRVKFDYVMLVGGFGQCCFLQNAVNKLYSDTRVLIPNESQLAIVKGAVMFGKKPSVIKTRIARHSYGFDVMVPFKEGVHDRKYMDSFGGITYCSGLFKSILKKGTSISNDHRSQHNVRNPIGSHVEIDFFCSTDENPIYIFDNTCTKVSTLGINNCQSQDIVIEVFVGGTELVIKGRDKESSTWYTVNIDYK